MPHLAIAFPHFDPVLVQMGPVAIRWYGVGLSEFIVFSLLTLPTGSLRRRPPAVGPTPTTRKCPQCDKLMNRLNTLPRSLDGFLPGVARVIGWSRKRTNEFRS